MIVEMGEWRSYLTDPVVALVGRVAFLSSF